MRKLVGALAAVISLLTVMPSASQAWGGLTSKYGLELQLGGGYLSLSDLNNYVPADRFVSDPAKKINVGAQFGLGILYRQQYDFGWQFGYNRFVSVMDSKFRISDGRYPESWAEQTLTGSELYALATWYWPSFWQTKWWWPFKEVSFAVGPAIYNATLDRSVEITQEGGGTSATGSFAGATGRSLGFLGTLGVEIPLKETLGLSIQVGGRAAKVSKLVYTDDRDLEVSVPLNSAVANSTMPVDFTGFFVKIGLRGYFQPASDWRTPAR